MISVLELLQVCLPLFTVSGNVESMKYCVYYSSSFTNLILWFELFKNVARHDVLGFSNWLGIPSCVIGDVPVIGVHLGTSWGCWCVFLCVSSLLIVIRSGTCGWSSRTLNISCFPGWEQNYLCQRFINNSRFLLYCGSHPPWAVCNWWVLTLRLCNEK